MKKHVVPHLKPWQVAKWGPQPFVDVAQIPRPQRHPGADEMVKPIRPGNAAPRRELTTEQRRQRDAEVKARLRSMFGPGAR